MKLLEHQTWTRLAKKLEKMKVIANCEVFVNCEGLCYYLYLCIFIFGTYAIS